jgi:type I restriction enzyme R subunit
MPTEADTCRTYVLPRLYDAGWKDDQIGEQRTFTDGRIHVAGGKPVRGRPKRADYLLRYQRDYPIAVIEAKAAHLRPSDGMQQAKDYAGVLGLLFAYSTNGQGIIEYDFHTGVERAIEAFPSPAELWSRYRAAKGLGEELVDKLLVPNYTSREVPRYYQQIAINGAVEAITKGDKRVLLTLATGTGKTVIAFQICWRLWKAKWNVRGLPERSPRMLFLADRAVLVDDPKDKTFAPFAGARHKIQGRAELAREMYFATYQAIARDKARPGLYRDYPPDFFDLIIVDEAHRGSARDDSNWREILEYFTGATQLGMTATPLREENRDTYLYFGDPIYTYSLKQGIQDGFLAPYEVRRIVTNIDTVGYRPTPGQLDDYGRAIEDREYTTGDFERVLSIRARTDAVAKHLTAYLKSTNRWDKTIVFCTDQDHAEHMRQALSQANADLMRMHPTYVARVTSDDGDLGRGLLSSFQDVEKQVPVVVTTSRLLTTGVDAPMVKNVVLFRVINSLTDFKQIIGRGTRVRADEGKFYFTILDYTGSATKLFADPDFDGEPARIVEVEMGAEGQTESETDLPVPEVAPDAPEPLTYDPARPGFAWIDEEPLPRKLYLSHGVAVDIVHEMVQELDASGKVLRVVELTVYTREQVRTLYHDRETLRANWTTADQRADVLRELADRGIALEHLAGLVGMPEADPFDVLCHIAFNAPLYTRRQRADRLRSEQRGFLARFALEARAILESLLDHYADYGPSQIALPAALELPDIEPRGNPLEIAQLFGGPQQLRDAVTELQTLLYAA